MAETGTTYAAMLKEYYTAFQIAVMVFRNCPWFAIVPKNTEIEGESWDVPIITADPQAGSATFSSAQGNKGNTSSSKFQVTTANDYAFAAVTRKVMKQSRSNKGSFLPAVRPNVDGAFNTSKRSIGIHGYEDGAGAKSQIESFDDTGADGIVTLGNTTDGAIRHNTVRWQKGEKFQLSATKSGGALKDSGAAVTIKAIDHQAGTITVDGKLGVGISGAAADDFMYREGDYDGAVTGLDGWITAAAPSATSFFGVDRSNDPEALGGVRYDGTSQQVKEALINGQSEVSTVGDGMPDHAMMHPSQFRKLLVELGGDVELDNYRVNQVVSFRGVTIQGDAGEIRCIPDRYALAAAMFLVQLDTFEFGSLGPMPEIFDAESDQEMLRESASDGYEIRVGGYGNYACHAPGYNGRVSLDLAL